MRKFLFLLFLSTCILSYGQDIIYQPNGSELKAKIVEITTNEIKYKDFDYQEGPTRNIFVSNVFMVIYENGKREYFTTQNNQASTASSYSGSNTTNKDDNNPSTFSKAVSKTKEAANDFDKKKLRYAAKFGFNLCNIHQNFSDEDNELDTKVKLGINLGLLAEYNINTKWDFQTGFLLTGKGCKYDIDGNPKLRLSYLEIPLNAVYKWNDFRFIAGSSLNFGVGGKYKTDDGDIKYKSVIGKVKDGDLDDDEEAYRCLDFGLNLGASYPVGPITLSANYELGLSNLSPKYENNSSYHKDYKLHNRVFSISAIYYIDDLMKLLK